MGRNKFLRLTLAALLAVSTVVSVPAAAEEKQDVTEANMPLSEFIEQNPEVMEQGGQGIGLEDYLDEGNEPVVVQPHPDGGNEVEFSAGSKEGVTQATISLGDYLEQHPEVLNEFPAGTSLEDYLGQTNDIQVMASTGTWEQLSNGDWKFVLSNGSYASEWHEINGAWYYFDPYNDDIMVTGWDEIGGYWYYFNPSGSMKHGWLSSTRNGKTIYYYMGRPGEPDTGAMYTGGWLHDIDDDWYYLYTNSDASQHGSDWGWEPGVMHVGWLEVGGDTYYLHTTDGHMATSANTMSPYVRTTFDSSGAWVSDYMIPQGTYTTSEGTFQRENVRWADLEVINGHRIPVVTISNNGIDEYFDTNYNVTPFDDAMDYFAGSATEWFELEEEQPLYANITLTWYNFNDYVPMFYSVTVAQTCCMNSDGEWLNGYDVPHDATPGTGYTTGTNVRAVIYFNTEIQYYHDTIDAPDNPNDFPRSIHNAVRHEILHALGLRHTHERGQTDSMEYAIMYPTCMSDDYTAITFQSYDEDELNKTYPFDFWEEE